MISKINTTQHYTFWNRLALLLLIGCSAGSPAAQADSLDNIEVLTQNQFLTLSENVAAATSYKALIPAEPLGVLGFDVALSVSATQIEEEVLDLASTGGFDLGRFLVPRLQVHKGLPMNVDIGASLTAIPDTDFKVMGAEIRYSFLEGSIATPAMAVRLTHSRIDGVDELDLSTTGLELTISKGFANLTPYAGVGMLRTESSTNVLTLEEESFDQNRVYAGLNINMGINLAFEVDQTGDYSTISAKAGLRF